MRASTRCVASGISSAGASTMPRVISSCFPPGSPQCCPPRRARSVSRRNVARARADASAQDTTPLRPPISQRRKSVPRDHRAKSFHRKRAVNRQTKILRRIFRRHGLCRSSQHFCFKSSRPVRYASSLAQSARFPKRSAHIFFDLQAQFSPNVSASTRSDFVIATIPRGIPNKLQISNARASAA